MTQMADVKPLHIDGLLDPVVGRAVGCSISHGLVAP